MKELVIAFFSLLVTLSCVAQDWDKVLRYELFNALIEQKDSVYITDRKTLERVIGHNCIDNQTTFEYRSKKGDKIEISIENGLFKPSSHKIEIADTFYQYIDGQRQIAYSLKNDLIDNKQAYGVSFQMPKTYLKKISIKWNGKDVSIPEKAYSDLFESHLCLDYLPVEAYLSEDQKLYIYIAGSDAAGGYSVKFVFDNNKYLTRIISTNEMTNGFDFLDGTAKVEN